MIISSRCSTPLRKRSALNSAMSSVLVPFTISSAMIRPVAGDCMKPWPLKPVAYRKRPGPANSPITAFSSGLRSYSPAHRRHLSRPRAGAAHHHPGRHLAVAGLDRPDAVAFHADAGHVRPNLDGGTLLAGPLGQPVGRCRRIGPALAAAPGGAHQPFDVE